MHDFFASDGPESGGEGVELDEFSVQKSMRTEKFVYQIERKANVWVRCLIRNFLINMQKIFSELLYFNG